MGEKLVFIRLPSLEPSGGAPSQSASAVPWTDIRSLECEQHLQRISARQFSRGPTREVISDVVRHLEARGLDYDPRPMATRIGYADNKLYLDLGGSNGYAVEISPMDPVGYRVVSDPPLIFRRGRDFGELPAPTSGGYRAMFDSLFPNLTKQGRDALLGVLVGSFLPDGAYPCTFLTGPQGSGKSVTSDLIRSMIDPLKSGGGRGTLPSKVEDLMTIVASGYLATFDNASRINEDIANALCQISTGGNMQVRKLYTQGQVFTNHVRNPLLLSSVALPHDKQDLLSRSVLLEFKPLGLAMQGEGDVKARFAKDLPAILGWLCSAVALALRDASRTKVSPSSRLVAAEQFVTAAEPRLGCLNGAIVSAWNDAREAATMELKGSDSVIALLQKRLTFIGDSISGTSTFIRDELVKSKTDPNGRVSLPPDFPKTAQSFSIHLPKIGVLLEAEGLQATKGTHTNAGSAWKISRIALAPPPTGTVTVTRPFAPVISPILCAPEKTPPAFRPIESVLDSAA